jgi:hypothetical protein
MRILLLSAAVAAALAVAPLAQVVRYVDGLFIHPGDGGAAIELIAWAEATSRGSLRMTRGSLDDAPAVRVVARVLSSIPLWRPVGAFIATTDVFRDERAERRLLPFATRKLNIYAIEVRISDLERREKIDQLLRDVRASADMPGYAFVVLSGGDYERYYPVRLSPADR